MVSGVSDLIKIYRFDRLDSLGVPSSEEQMSNVSSPTQTIASVEQGLPAVTSDNEASSMEETTARPMLNYSLSICVPCTDAQTGICLSRKIQWDTGLRISTC